MGRAAGQRLDHKGRRVCLRNCSGDKTMTAIRRPRGRHGGWRIVAANVSGPWIWWSVRRSNPRYASLLSTLAIVSSAGTRASWKSPPALPRGGRPRRAGRRAGSVKDRHSARFRRFYCVVFPRNDPPCVRTGLSGLGQASFFLPRDGGAGFLYSANKRTSSR